LSCDTLVTNAFIQINSVTRNMEAICSSETLVRATTTQCKNSNDNLQRNNYHGNIRTYTDSSSVLSLPKVRVRFQSSFLFQSPASLLTDSRNYASNELKVLTQSAGAKLTASAKLYPWLKPA